MTKKSFVDDERDTFDLDVLANKKSRALPVREERGDFLTGSDTIEDFLELNRIKTVSGEESHTVQIPMRVFKRLNGDGSKFEQLQSFFIQRDMKIMMGRIFNDLKYAVSFSDLPSEPYVKPS